MIKKFYDREPVKGIEFIEPSLVDVSFEQECDLHFILDNFMRNGGTLDKLKDRVSKLSYGDSPSDDAYLNAQMLVAACNSQFNDLPAIVREEFDNNVSNYLAYVSDPSNLKDAYERHLIDPNTVDKTDIEKLYAVDTTKVVEDNKAEKPETPES